MLLKCLCSVPKEQMQIMSLVFHICTAPYFALITILFVFCPLSTVPQTNGHFSFILSWRFSISNVMEQAGFWLDLNVTYSLSFPSPCSLSLWGFPSLCVREHVHVELPHTTCSNAHILIHVYLTPALSLLFPFLPHSFSISVPPEASAWTVWWREWWSATTTSTWPTSLRGSSPFSSPRSWRSRDIVSTLRRWLPC